LNIQQYDINPNAIGVYLKSAPHHAFIVYAYDIMIAHQLSLCYILTLKPKPTLTPSSQPNLNPN